jgi:hypothetical protein
MTSKSITVAILVASIATEIFASEVWIGRNQAADIQRFAFDGTPLGLLSTPTQTDAIAVVPEPSTLAFAAFGFVALAAFGWRRRKR